jgi:ribonucleoside-diphosphate reductase alpha chain
VDGITTTELDNITANLSYSWTTTHPDYGTLASRIAVSNHQKNTPATLLEVMDRLSAVRDRKGESASILDPELHRGVRENATLIESHIDYERDFNLDFFGFRTLEKAYLLRDTDRKVVERPQHLWMRVALGLWLHDLPHAFKTYDLMSQKYYTHATPTLFNAGTKRPQLSSCFLLAMNDDSIRGIYKTLEDCALISQYGGGIGLHLSNIRAKGSLIKGTGGLSNGVVPMLRVFNNTARYVDQGGGKRNGSFAMYLEPWHADVEDFLQMKRNTGSEEERARDLFYALWVPDLFMERVDANEDWTLFCPNEAPGLADVVGGAGYLGMRAVLAKFRGGARRPHRLGHAGPAHAGVRAGREHQGNLLWMERGYRRGGHRRHPVAVRA